MTTFRHRTMVYRARKEIENKSKIKVRLDLTKTRYDVLKSANRLVKGVEKVKWVYADIDVECRMIRNSFLTQLGDLDNIIEGLVLSKYHHILPPRYMLLNL